MKVVVTGAAGLVGRYVVADLHERGYDVFCADRAPLASVPGRQLACDLTDISHMEKVIAGAGVSWIRLQSRFSCAGRNWIHIVLRKR